MDNILAENLLLICSICLESISNYEERSCAKLKCGHEFHLDCIGSAFNKKGAMMCPNCRNVEDGTWLYGNGSTSSSDFDDWDPALDLLDAISAYDDSTFSGMTEEQLLFEQMRSTWVDADAMSRSGPSALPFHYSDTSFTRGRSSFVSSHNHLGSITHLHERIQVSHVGHPPQGNPTSLISPIMPGARRLSGPMGMPISTPAPPQGGFSYFSQNLHLDNRNRLSHFPVMSFDRESGFSYFSQNLPLDNRNRLSRFPVMSFDRESGFSYFSQNLPLDNRNRLSRFPVMSFDRESGWESQRQAYGGSDASHRSGNFWPQ